MQINVCVEHGGGGGIDGSRYELQSGGKQARVRNQQGSPRFKAPDSRKPDSHKRQANRIVRSIPRTVYLSRGKANGARWRKGGVGPSVRLFWSVLSLLLGHFSRLTDTCPTPIIESKWPS